MTNANNTKTNAVPVPVTLLPDRAAVGAWNVYRLFGARCADAR